MLVIMFSIRISISLKADLSDSSRGSCDIKSFLRFYFQRKSQNVHAINYTAYYALTVSIGDVIKSENMCIQACQHTRR